MCFEVYKSNVSENPRLKKTQKWVLEMKIILRNKDGTTVEIQPDSWKEASKTIRMLSQELNLGGDLDIEKSSKKLPISEEIDIDKPKHVNLSTRIKEALMSSPWGDRARNLKEICDYIGGDYNPVSGVLTYLYKKEEIERIGEMRDYQYFLPEKRRLVIGTVHPPDSQNNKKHQNLIHGSKLVKGNLTVYGTKKTQKQQILDVLFLKGKPMLAREIAKKLPHIDNEKIFRALANMVIREQIHRTGRPMNYRYYM